MVGRDDDERVGMAFLKLDDHVQRFIERDLIIQRRGRIGIVSGMVDAGTLDLQDELLAPFEPCKRRTHEVREHGNLVAQFRVVALIDRVRQMSVGESSDQSRVQRRRRKPGFVGHNRISGFRKLGIEVALVLASRAFEKRRTTAQQHVHLPIEILRCDGIGISA